MIRSISGNLLRRGPNGLRAVLAETFNGKPGQEQILRYQSTDTKPVSQTDKYLKYSETEGYVKSSPYKPITVPELTLDQYIWQNINRWADKIAAVCVVTGRSYTFSKLRDSCAAFAVRLQKNFNLQSGDVIAICLPNLPEYPIAVFGALEAGLTVTTVNPIYTADEIARQLIGSNSKLIITADVNYEVTKNACDLAKKDIPILCIPMSGQVKSIPSNAINFFEMIDPKGVNFSDLKPTNATPDSLAFLPYSSGTTGLPKGVMLTHRNIISNCEMVQTKIPNDYYMLETNDNYQEIIPCFLPFFHIYGLTVTMISKLFLGCQLVTMPKFTPEDLLKSMIHYKGTVLNLVPPVLLMLTNAPTVKREFLDSVRCIFTGAAPCGALDAERFLEKFPNILFVQGYGLTETSPVCLLTPIGNKKYASTGFLTSSSEAKIVAFDDDTATGLGPNKTGELCIRGHQIMKGYLGNDEANEKAFHPNGWLRTGDVSYYDDEGYFYITDRMKELIKVKGFQVPPAELEEILRSHPKILDAAVFGVPHPSSGEVPKAVVVSRPGEKVNENDIKEFVAEKVAPFKQLAGGVVFVKEIPKNASGKILRRNLREQYCN